MNLLPQLSCGQALGLGDILVSSSGNYFAGIVGGTVLNAGAFGVFAGSPTKPVGTSLVLTNFECEVVQLRNDGELAAGPAPRGGVDQSPYWIAGTQGTTNFCIMQDDGNLCVYQGTGPSDNHAFLWGTIQLGGKTSDHDPFPPRDPHSPLPPDPTSFNQSVTVNGKGAFLSTYSVQWNGGESEESNMVYQGQNAAVDFNGPPIGTECWLRAYFKGVRPNLDSAETFQFGNYPVSYDINGTLFDASWSRNYD